MKNQSRLLSMIAGCVAIFAVTALLDARSASPAPRAETLRRPVALTLDRIGRWLYAANQRSGTVVVIDTSINKQAAEEKVGKQLSDLVAAPDGSHWLATDEEGHELVVLACRGTAVRIERRIPVSPYPVTVSVAADGRRACVLSLWSRRLTLIDFTPPLFDNNAGDVTPRVVKVIDLSFAPRKQRLVQQDSRLLVADAFGGRLAVVDLTDGSLESVRALPAHNLRGLALSRDGKQLLIAHQHLSQLAHTTQDNVHWGNVVSNRLTSLPLAHVLPPGADLLRRQRSELLGDVGRGAGDPAAVAVAPDGTTLVALAGTGEIAWQKNGADDWIRLAVGHRPTAVLVSPDGSRAYVANTLSDSVSVVNLKECKVEAEVALGAAVPLTEADRGELLFFDARLSHDGWFSCHSCHTDGHSNGLLNDNLGDDSYGAPKRVLTLLGTKDTAPWAWNGQLRELESQIRKSILTTMHGPKPSKDQVKDLAAFLRSLPPPPATGLLSGPADEAARRRGQEAFAKLGCDRCHTPPTYTSPLTYDVGITDEVGNAQFNPPSLRGVSQGGPYFHDNRAATLEEVFVRHCHQLRDQVSKQELADLLTFLRSL